MEGSVAGFDVALKRRPNLLPAVLASQSPTCTINPGQFDGFLEGWVEDAGLVGKVVGTEEMRPWLLWICSLLKGAIRPRTKRTMGSRLRCPQVALSTEPRPLWNMDDPIAILVDCNITPITNYNYIGGGGLAVSADFADKVLGKASIVNAALPFLVGLGLTGKLAQMNPIRP